MTLRRRSRKPTPPWRKERPIKTAFLVLGEAACFDRERFESIEHDFKSDVLVALNAGQNLNFAFCFELADPSEARRWAVLTAMRAGTRVVKITGVERSLAKRGEDYVFSVRQKLVAYPPLPLPTQEPPEDE